MANQLVTLELNTAAVSATTRSDSYDWLLYDEFCIFWLVSNGSATAGHTLDLVFETCDTDSDDNDDWFECTESTFTQVTGTGGANAWPYAEVEKFTEWSRYVRCKLTPSAGDWTVRVVATLRD